MKSIKRICILVVLCVATVSSYAQDLTENYSRAYASFAIGKLKDYSDSADKGVQIGYIYGYNITGNNAPLFLQIGAEGNLITSSEDGIRETIMGLAAPINLSYKLGFSDNLSIEPFAGVNLRYNMMAKLTSDDSDEELDYFDELDAKHFQFGINVGATININNLSIGYRFNPDMSNFFGFEGIDTKTQYHFISLGVNF